MSADDGGLDVPNGPDAPEIDSTNPQPTVSTPDPYATADQASYSGDGSGPDVAIEYVPPWAQTRAPGTVETIAAGEIVPIDPWRPVIALLNGNQLAMLNRESAARQAASFWINDQREV